MASVIMFYDMPFRTKTKGKQIIEDKIMKKIQQLTWALFPWNQRIITHLLQSSVKIKVNAFLSKYIIRY